MARPQDTTRLYNQTSVRATVTATGTAAVALPSLNTLREIRVVSTVRAYIRFGTNNAGNLDTPATVGANSFPLPADRPEILRIPQGVTHFAVIRDGAVDGVIDVHAVV